MYLKKLVLLTACLSVQYFTSVTFMLGSLELDRLIILLAKLTILIGLPLFIYMYIYIYR